MRSDDLKTILRGLTRRPVRPATRRRDLESDLLALHATKTRPGRTMTMTTLYRRPALVALLIAVLGIAACTVPTETEVEMGQRLTYTATPGDASYGEAVKMLDDMRDALSYVENYPGVESVGVNVQEVDGGEATVDMMIWGRGIAVDALTRDLAERFPAMSAAKLESAPLTTSVKTTLAENVGHHFFDIEVTDGTPEEIRAEILRQILESGFDGEADVTVAQDGDVTTIGVTMTEETDGMATEDEIVLEIKEEQ